MSLFDDVLQGDSAGSIYRFYPRFTEGKYKYIPLIQINLQRTLDSVLNKKKNEGVHWRPIDRKDSVLTTQLKKTM